MLVPGAGDFVMTPLDGETSASDLVATLRTVEQPSVPGHERLDRGDRITHTFENLEAGNWFGFAVRMPGGVPVAGLMEIRNVDRGMKTLDIRHRFLKTDGARAVFAEPHHADQELGLVFRHLKEQETDETPFVGEWTAEVPEDLGDYRLALGVMDVDGNDLSLVRTHVDDYAGYNAEAVEEYWRNFQVRARGLAFPGHQ